MKASSRACWRLVLLVWKELRETTKRRWIIHTGDEETKGRKRTSPYPAFLPRPMPDTAEKKTPYPLPIMYKFPNTHASPTRSCWICTYVYTSYFDNNKKLVRSYRQVTFERSPFQTCTFPTSPTSSLIQGSSPYPTGSFADMYSRPHHHCHLDRAAQSRVPVLPAAASPAFAFASAPLEEYLSRRCWRWYYNSI